MVFLVFCVAVFYGVRRYSGQRRRDLEHHTTVDEKRDFYTDDVSESDLVDASLDSQYNASLLERYYARKGNNPK